MAPNFEAELNPEQLAAVTHGEGPQLVLAGAGTGKTRVITYRIAWLVEERGVDPRRITAVTFTNKAAGEMRDRAEELLGLYPLPAFVGTFHRYALIMLRRYGERVGLPRGFVILDTSDQRRLVKQALEAEGLAEQSFPPNSVLATISGAKNQLVGPSEFAQQADGFYQRRVAPVYATYQKMARQASGIDFDDMIALAVRLLEEEDEVAERQRWRAEHLLVDEYQDTNHAQLRLIRALAGPDGNLTAVGDEDQGIYRWRGAELANILNFEDSFPDATVRKLERNYRSTQNILDASGAVVAQNVGRRGKELWTDSGAGEPLDLYRASDEADEARRIVGTLRQLSDHYQRDEMAILVRTNAQTRALEEELLRQGLPYQLIGGVRFYERAEIKDLIAYLRLLRNPRDLLSFLRVINQPPRGIGKVTLERLRQTAAELGQPMWDVLYQDELGGLPARSAAALRGFRDLILDLQEKAAELPLPALLDALLEKTGYLGLYRPDDSDDQARLENIQELLSAAQELAEARSYSARGVTGDGEEDDGDSLAASLTAFLDHVALVSDVDDLDKERGVSLMTLHSAKGLEFDVVTVSGLEEGLLPHFNAQGTPEDIEEERRLFYVGMTRARKRLFLTCCRRRRIAGFYQNQRESPFLADVPKQLIEITDSPSLFADRRRDVYSFFSERAGGGRGGARGGGRTGGAPTGAADGLAKGARVRHPTLGQGVVLDLDGSGESAKITVFFDREGKRKLIAKYARLEVL